MKAGHSDLVLWIVRPKLNLIPHIRQFEIPVNKLTADFIHFIDLLQNKILIGTVVLHDESSPQSQHANGKNSTCQCASSTVTEQSPPMKKWAGHSEGEFQRH